MVPTIAVNRAPPNRPNRIHPFPPPIVEAVDQDVDADMDAGAHAIGGAELRHPDEHVDAEFLGPGEVDPEQIRIEDGNIDQIAMGDRDEGEHRRGAHQARDDDLFQPVENAQKHLGPRPPLTDRAAHPAARSLSRASRKRGHAAVVIVCP
jgi:hypothetical protein